MSLALALWTEALEEVPLLGLLAPSTTSFPVAGSGLDGAPGDLVRALADLRAGRRSQITVPLITRDERWEIGLEREGEQLFLTALQHGIVPRVVVHRFPLSLDGACRNLASSLKSGPSVNQRLLTGPIGRLRPSAEPMVARVRSSKAQPFDIGAGFSYRPIADEPSGSMRSQRAEVFPLLFQGTVEFSWKRSTVRLDKVFLFLLAELLVSASKELLDAHLMQRPLFRRLILDPQRIQLRLDSSRTVALALGPASKDPGADSVRVLEGLSVRAVVRAVREFSRALTSTVVECQPSLNRNLRLKRFRDSVRDLHHRMSDAWPAKATGQVPLSFADVLSVPASDPAPSSQTAPRGRIRYMPLWTADVPAFDRNSFFLCADGLLLGSERDLILLHRTTGQVLWRRQLAPARSAVSARGLVRLSPNGEIRLLEVESGEDLWRSHILPSAASAPCLTLVETPSGPPLAIVSDGPRALSAVDLATGELVWRHSLRRPGACQVTLAGRLLLVVNGDSRILGLDAQTGELAWEAVEPNAALSQLIVDRDTVYAWATDAARGKTLLLGVDLRDGTPRFRRMIAQRGGVVALPVVTSEHVHVAMESDRSTELVSLELRSDKQHRLNLQSARVDMSRVDDTLFVCREEGEIVAFDALTLVPRYRRTLSQAGEPSPRTLKPTLRGGALFVPLGGVSVIRPDTGESLGQVSPDLVCDWVRVDESCGIFAAEESGHVAAFGATQRLMLVHSA